jgi:hypothetical protein
MNADALDRAMVDGDEHRRQALARYRRGQVGAPSVDAPLRARENFRTAVRVVGCCHLSGLLNAAASCRTGLYGSSRTGSKSHLACLMHGGGTLVFPIPSRRLLRHTLLPIALRPSRSCLLR